MIDDSSKEQDDKWTAARKRALKYAESLTPEEDAAITAAAEADPDNPLLTDEFMAGMRPTSEVAPEFLEAWREWKKQQEGKG